MRVCSCVCMRTYPCVSMTHKHIFSKSRGSQNNITALIITLSPEWFQVPERFLCIEQVHCGSPSSKRPKSTYLAEEIPWSPRWFPRARFTHCFRICWPLQFPQMWETWLLKKGPNCTLFFFGLERGKRKSLTIQDTDKLLFLNKDSLHL